MTDIAASGRGRNGADRLVPVVALGLSLGLFFAISYVLCILLYLLLPGAVLNHAMLSLFLPGFKLLSWTSFILGLVESFGYGWYVALIFGPLYNFFAARSR
jgi:hypothetical protein